MADEDGAAEQPAVTGASKARGRVARLAVGVGDAVPTRAVDRIDLTLEGIAGDRHAGFVRAADSRVPWYKRGDPIHNERQLSIVSLEELAAIAARLGLPAIEPEWLGANLMVDGIPSVSMLPRGTRLFFPSGAALAVTDQNAPCRLAGRSLAKAVGGGEDLAFRFVQAARRLRGVVAVVDRAGAMMADDPVELRVPEQWIWRPGGGA